MASQAARNGFDPKEAIIALSPRKGEYTLRTSDILEKVDSLGNEIALVLFPGVQYYSGQLFQMEQITQSARAKVGFSVLYDTVAGITLDGHAIYRVASAGGTSLMLSGMCQCL